jgi:hypothetical protein
LVKEPIDYYSLIKVKQENFIDNELNDIKPKKFYEKSSHFRSNFKLNSRKDDPLIKNKRNIYLND